MDVRGLWVRATIIMMTPTMPTIMTVMTPTIITMIMTVITADRCCLPNRLLNAY